MGKATALGAAFFVSQYDLSGDTRSLSSIQVATNPIDVTGIDKSAHERLAGLRDGNIEWVSYWNDSAGQAVPALKGPDGSDRIVTFLQSSTIGDSAFSMVGKQVTFAPERGDDGSLTIGVQAQANGFGLECGQSLTAGKITHSSATAGTAVDFVAGTNFGLQAYLHIFSLSSGTPTVKIQESSDNAGDAYADVTGGAFTLQAVGSQRIATASNLAVERFLKVTTTGTFSNLVFAVTVIRNTIAPVF